MHPEPSSPAFAVRLLLAALIAGSTPAAAPPAAAADPGPGTTMEKSVPAEQGAAVAEWSQFRGPERSGRSPETGLARTWPEEGPPVVWRRPLGEGFSGISVAGERLCTLYAIDEEEYLACFRSADGEELWRLPMGEKFHENFGNGPRSTPTLDGGTVYGLGAAGRLVAADLETGEVRWQLELTERYGITDPQTLNPLEAKEGLQLPLYGYAGSPLVEGDLLIVETGARHGRSVVALDKRTGEERWVALDDEIGYASPVAVDMGGRRQILVLPGSSIVSLSPAGEELWRYPWATNPSQPLFVPPDKVFVSTVSDVGAMLLRIEGTGEAAELEELWRIRRLKNAWNSSILHEGHFYGFDNATFRCVSLETGELLWAARGFGQGTLVFADGLLIVLSDRGVLSLVEPSPEGHEVAARAQVLEGRTWTAPTLAAGILYLRNHEEMVALDLRRSAG